ncbi:MAG TPA: hypothetical protein VMN81_12890 [Vicinamibacterales bacterium]|nr:hypothetical protein [Vicinamibacterales bacterium]
MCRTLLSAALALCVAAPPAFAQTPQEVPSLKVEQPAVTVLSTGSGPKRLLRYKVPADTKDRIDMTMHISMSMDVLGMGEQRMDAPPMKLGLDVDVTNVAENGDITYVFTFVEASMDGPGLPADALDLIKGLTGTATMSDRGFVRAMAFDKAKGANPMFDQFMSASGIDRMSAPLPEEPLGVGAKWEVAQVVESGGIRLDQKATYEITAMDATSATMALTVDQRAANQTLTPPGMPPGAEATLVSMAGAGTGRMTFADGDVAPLGDLTLKSQMTMDMAAEGESMRMSMGTDMKMTMARGKR